jgi:hypothetical protein
VTYTPKVRVIAGSGGKRKLHGQKAVFWQYWRIGRDFESESHRQIPLAIYVEKRKIR